MVKKMIKRKIIIDESDDILTVKQKKINLLEKDNKNIRYIIHLSDIHIRKNQREIEYREVFNGICNDLIEKGMDNDNSVIVITGDILHEKEMLGCTVNLLKDFFIKLSEVTTIVSIIGNHDINIHTNELDSISPVIGKAFDTKNKIHLLLNDAVYIYNNIRFGVTTTTAKCVTECKKKEGYINIGLYHGIVNGSKDEFGYLFKNTPNQETYMEIDKFKQYYDYTLLGDIHKHQFLDKEKTVWYAGSLIQQKRSESLNSGYVILDLHENKAKFNIAKNNYAMVEYIINEDGSVKVDIDDDHPQNLDVKLICKHSNKEIVDKVYDKLKEMGVNIVNKINIYDYSNYGMKMEIDLGGKKKDILDIKDKNTIAKTLIDYITEHKKIKKDKLKNITTKINELVDDVNYESKDKCKTIKLKRLEFDNILIYGEGNIIDFTQFKNVVGLNDINNAGKSSLIDTILIAIYGKCSRGDVRNDILHHGAKSYNTSIELIVNGKNFKIERHANKASDDEINLNNIKVSEKVKLYINGKNISDSGIKKTNDKIAEKICSYDDMILCSFVNNDNISFLNMKEDDKRKLLCKITNIDIYDIILAKCITAVNSLRQTSGKINKESTKFNNYGNNSDTDINDIHINIQKEFDKLTNEKQTLDKNIYDNMATRRNYEDQLIKLQTQKEQIESNALFNEKIEYIEFNESDKKDLETDIINLRDEIEKLEKNNNLVDNKMKKFGDINKILEKFNCDKANKINLLNKEINKLNRQIVNISGTFNEDKLLKERDILMKGIDKINSFIKTYEGLRMDQNEKNNIIDLYKKYRDYENEILELEKNNKKINDDINKLEIKYAEFQDYQYDENCKFCIINSLTKQKKYLEDDIKLNKNKIIDNNKEIKRINLYLKKNNSITMEYDNMINNEENIKSLDEKKAQLLYNNTKLENINEKIQKIQIEKDNKVIESQIEKLENEMADIENSVCSEYNEYVELKSRYDSRNMKILDKRKELQNKQEKVRQLEIVSRNKDKYENHMKLKKDFIDLVKNIKSINKQLDDIKKVINEHNNKLDTIKLSLSKVNDDLLLIKLIKDKRTENINDIDDYNIIINSLQNNGIIDNILENKILPQLELIVNKILTNVGYNNIQIRHCNKKILIAGQDNISKTMDGRNGLHVMNILFRIALSQLSNYVRTNFFIIDEAFDSCDIDGGLERMIKIIELAKVYYDWILIVSHNTDIKATYDKKLDIITVREKEKQILSI